MRRTLLILVTACFLGTAQNAAASGGSYAFTGGTAAQQATVHSALEASSFSWSLIPRTIRIHIGAVGSSYSTAGDIYLDGGLLDAGVFSWGVVQHEMGHQVDFFLLDDAKRARIMQLLGGKDWCYGVSGLKHADYGCERFASELAWAYWQSTDNSMRPTLGEDEAAGMPVALFRAMLADVIGAPTLTPVVSPAVKAYAPPVKPKPKKPALRRR